MATKVIWGKLLNRWLDEGPMYHALKPNGAPICGVAYRSSTGEYPYPPSSESQCCRNCLRRVKAEKSRRRR